MVDEIEVKNARDRITTEFINGYYDFIHHEIKNGIRNTQDDLSACTSTIRKGVKVSEHEHVEGEDR